MNISEIYPNPGVKITKTKLTDSGVAGTYDPPTDTITICTSLLPLSSVVTELHELMHATGVRSRGMRRTRLIKQFKAKAYQVEECIAELATMIAMKKMGIYNMYSSQIPIHGLNKYYSKDIFIPWKEVISAVNHFKGDDVDFSVQADFIKRYVKAVLRLNIKEGYEDDTVPPIAL